MDLSGLVSREAAGLAEIAPQPAGLIPAAGEPPEWTAIVLAGERPGGDPLARHFGSASKAAIPVAGVSMIRRVVATLRAVPAIGRVVILAQDPAAVFRGDAADLCRDLSAEYAESGIGIASSIAAAIQPGTLGWPVLVTTADHALLTPAMVTEFLAEAQDCDLAVGFGERKTVEAAYPETRRTWLKFADGHFSGANLFALRNHRVSAALRLWSEVEQDRKNGLKLLSRFGPLLLARALTRTVALPDALARAGLGLGVFARAVVLRDPEAAIDVDKPDDHSLAERILGMRELDAASAPRIAPAAAPNI